MSKKASYKDARREINSKEVDEQMINSCDDQEDETMIEDLRRGTWTAEEDMALMNYISHHGEGRWNSLTHSAGNWPRNYTYASTTRNRSFYDGNSPVCCSVVSEVII